MAKAICPNCGSEVVLPEHSTFCSGMTISEETNGTFALPMKDKGDMNNMAGEKKMDEATLEVIKNAMGDAAYNALVEKIGLDNPMIQNIIEHGDLECGVDFHRWVLKQMTEYEFSWHNNWTKHFNSHVPFMKQFDDYRNKLKKVISLKKKGKLKAVDEELQFISKDGIVDVCKLYLKHLRDELTTRPTKLCKKVPYIEFKRNEYYGNYPGRTDSMIFVSDLNRKVFDHFEQFINKIERSILIEELYDALSSFMNFKYFIILDHKYRYAKSKIFINDFKGYGAYFALKDSIRFFNVRLTEYETGKRLTNRDASMLYLEKCKNNALKNRENYTLLALLEQSWKDSGFNRASYAQMVAGRKRG